MIALPSCVPLIWGVLIKRAPAWSGWTTVLVGFATSLAAKMFLTPAWLENVMGWPANSLSAREADDWVLLLGVLLNTVVCSAWFLGTCWFARSRPAQEVEQTEQFFEQMRTPVDFHKEEGAGNDAQQYRTLGLMSLMYGAFISLLMLIPNSPGGRLGMFACAGTMLGVGGLLYWRSRAPQRAGNSPNPLSQTPIHITMGNLKEKRALITGGGQGLGYAIAEHLLEAGADVAIHYFSSEAGARELKSLAEAKGRRAEIFRADLTKEAEATALVNSAATFLGGLDILVNNTGDLVQRRALQEVDMDFWQRVMDVNVTSMMLVTRAAAAMAGQGGASQHRQSVLPGRAARAAIPGRWSIPRPRAPCSRGPAPWPTSLRRKASASMPSRPA